MEPLKLHTRAVLPVGKEAHTHLCTGREIEMDKYPESPTGDLMRDLRVTLGIGLRDAARLLGLQAVELSGLEMGRLELVDPAGGFQEVVRRFILHADRPRKALPL
jgi:hypothetical protein